MIPLQCRAKLPQYVHECGERLNYVYVDKDASILDCFDNVHIPLVINYIAKDGEQPNLLAGAM